MPLGLLLTRMATGAASKRDAFTNAATRRSFLHNDVTINQAIAGERSIAKCLIGYKLDRDTRPAMPKITSAPVIVRELSAHKRDTRWPGRRGKITSKSVYPNVNFAATPSSFRPFVPPRGKNQLRSSRRPMSRPVLVPEKKTRIARAKLRWRP